MGQVKYASVERFVDYAQELAWGGDYSNFEEFLNDAREQWMQYVAVEEGVLTDEIVTAAAPQLEQYLKEITASRSSAKSTGS